MVSELFDRFWSRSVSLARKKFGRKIQSVFNGASKEAFDFLWRATIINPNRGLHSISCFWGFRWDKEAPDISVVLRAKGSSKRAYLQNFRILYSLLVDPAPFGPRFGQSSWSSEKSRLNGCGRYGFQRNPCERWRPMIIFNSISELSLRPIYWSYRKSRFVELDTVP